MKNRDPTNPDIRELYHSTQKHYQSLINSKGNKYQAEKCKELEEADTLFVILEYVNINA